MTCSTCIHWRPTTGARGDCTLIGPGERGPGRVNAETYMDSSCDLCVPRNVRDLLAVKLAEAASVGHLGGLGLADIAIQTLKGSVRR